jgi:hypothetical protein
MTAEAYCLTLPRRARCRLTCHRPRRRTIHHAVASRSFAEICDYWMPAFAGMRAMML